MVKQDTSLSMAFLASMLCAALVAALQAVSPDLITEGLHRAVAAMAQGPSPGPTDPTPKPTEPRPGTGPTDPTRPGAPNPTPLPPTPAPKPGGPEPQMDETVLTHG
jgi:outer membrane biosynthesis protein TonB